MKNIKLIILIIIALSLQSINELSAQYTCGTSTPNGTYTQMVCSWSEPLAPWQIAALNNISETMFPNAYRWGNASGMYNCHSYAWYWSSLSNRAWMNSPWEDIYWLDGSYVPANWNNSTRISYGNNDYQNGDHSARNYPGYIGWAHSKWGKLPRMLHWYTDAPYGGPYRLYRR